MQDASPTILAQSTTPPTCSVRYQALLDEYNRLLERLREIPATYSGLTDTYLTPQPSSPLDLDARNRAAARKAGLKLRPDGQFSLAAMAFYYGIHPWDPTDATQHQTALNALDEKRARHALQLQSGIDIDELTCTPTESERKSLASRPRSTSLETLLVSLTESKIKDAVREFLPADETSLIGHLVKSLPSQVNVANVRSAPTVYLEKLLQSTDARMLAQSLLEKLVWYGSNPGEETSPTVRYKLLSRAIRLWERRDNGATRDVAGYQWHKRSNYGKSYQAIWTEFETHLQESSRASSPIEAILLATLYRFEFPGDFHRSDIPDDLPYKSSLVWVNFVHGLNLAEIIEPYRVSHMTFQQLVDFPLQELAQATEQERGLFASCRIPPSIDWAIANGIVLEDMLTTDPETAQKRAIEALDQYTGRLTAAIVRMDIDPPNRPDIADREISKVFRPKLLTTDGRKLLRLSGPIHGAGTLRDLKQKGVSFRDVYMWKGHTNRNWLITKTDGETPTIDTIRLDAEGDIHSTPYWIPGGTLPDVNKLFETDYQNWLTSTKAAYKTLLTHLFSCLPHDDLQAIEYGETKIYTLRNATQGLEADQETAALTLPFRLRMGLLLRLSNNGKTSWYECLPRAGIIRNRIDITDDMLNGRITTEQWRVSSTVRVQVRRGQSVPFDWEAHEKGHVPKKGAICTAIIEQLGKTYTPQTAPGHPVPISSNRAAEIAGDLADSFFYYDEDILYANCQKKTDLERLEEKRHTLLHKLVNFVPFFGNLADLDSNNPNKRINAIFGMFTDSLAFALPLGKFASGTAKLASTAVRMGYKQALPQFSQLVKQLAVSSLQNFNPLDGLPTLAKKLVQGLYATFRLTLISAVKLIERLAGRTGTYNIIKGLPVVSDPGRYRLLAPTDELAMTRRIADVPVRQVSNTQARDYRLIDPVANKPYGPPLADKTYRFWRGRSVYSAQEATDQLVTVRIADNAQVRSVPEIDGRTTVFIDDVPYRLDGDSLKRIELIDDGATFKRTPCRIKRAPGDGVCIDEFFSGGTLPETPNPGLFDESKGYAPWFGARICVPEPRSGQPGKFFLQDGTPYQVIDDGVKPWKGRFTDLGFAASKAVPKKEIQAKLQFRKGIYVRIEIHGDYVGSDGLHRVGAIVVPSFDGKSNYLFASPNRGNYYLETLPSTKQLDEHQTHFMKLLKPDEIKKDLGEELLRVFEGSMTANNMVAIHGLAAVENAISTMNRISIPLGTTPHPPANMKWVDVDTTPAEALMFDHRSRMIVTSLPVGATTWSRSQFASESFRQRCAAIFDTLFVQKTIIVKADSDLRINWTMDLLQKMLPADVVSLNPRNIAYADVVTSAGKREVYVSVSGGLGLTGELPLFKTPFPTNKVVVGDTTYFNIDSDRTFGRNALSVSSDGKVLSLPRTTPGKTKPETLTRPTSLDSEAKLISVLRETYPAPHMLTSVDIATTMPPCNSCAVVIKQFGYDGTTGNLNVLWG